MLSSKENSTFGDGLGCQPVKTRTFLSTFMCHTNPSRLLEISVKPRSHILCKRKVSARCGRLPETRARWSILGVFVFLQGLDLSAVSYSTYAGECRYVEVWTYFSAALE